MKTISKSSTIQMEYKYCEYTQGNFFKGARLLAGKHRIRKTSMNIYAKEKNN